MTAGEELRLLIPGFVADAKHLVSHARPHVSANVFPTVPDEDAAMTSKRAQGVVSAGLQQVGQAAKWETEQDGRDGYAQVVALMTSVATTAESIGKRMQKIIDPDALGGYHPLSADDYKSLAALTAAMQMLGELSPAAVWAPAPPTTSTTTKP